MSEKNGYQPVPSRWQKVVAMLFKWGNDVEQDEAERKEQEMRERLASIKREAQTWLET